MKRLRMHHVVLAVGLMPFLVSCTFHPWVVRTTRITPEQPLEASPQATEVRVVLDKQDRAYYAFPLTDGRELQVYTSADHSYALILDPATGRSERLTGKIDWCPSFLQSQIDARMNALHSPPQAEPTEGENQ